MKYAILILSLILLYGCNTSINTASTDTGTDTGNSGGGLIIIDPSDPEHIGCQEGEIDDDGVCVLAEMNNAGMFDQDLDSYVDSREISGPVKGFLAQPKEPGTYPGIVMIHEWWGLNDNIKQMAKILAKEGYVVFAVDLYDGEVATDSAKAGELAGSVRANPDEAVRKMRSAVELLRGLDNVDRIGSLGWCFGGGQSLQLSLNDAIDATVIYYGSLTDDKDQLKNLNGPVLGIFGSEDTGIPQSAIDGFKGGLDELGIKNSITVYPGVGHAFANPSGSNYAEAETLDAWAKTVAFLDENLKSRGMVKSQPLPDSQIKTFKLTGENFKFRLDGKEAPELRVKQGDRVKITLTSTDGFHDWVVDEFSAATGRVDTGETTTVEFVADKKGEFEYYCSVGQHRQNGMKGRLIVE